jgi:hypothetical protein
VRKLHFPYSERAGFGSPNDLRFLASLIGFLRYAFEGLTVFFYVFELTLSHTAFSFIPLDPLIRAWIVHLSASLNRTFARVLAGVFRLLCSLFLSDIS